MCMYVCACVCVCAYMSVSRCLICSAVECGFLVHRYVIMPLMLIERDSNTAHMCTVASTNTHSYEDYQ